MGRGGRPPERRRLERTPPSRRWRGVVPRKERRAMEAGARRDRYLYTAPYDAIACGPRSTRAWSAGVAGFGVFVQIESPFVEGLDQRSTAWGDGLLRVRRAHHAHVVSGRVATLPAAIICGW